MSPASSWSGSGSNGFTQRPETVWRYGPGAGGAWSRMGMPGMVGHAYERARAAGALDPPRLARRGLRRLELALDERQPLVPEARVGEVDADDRAQLLGAPGAARAEQLEVGGHERLALLLVAAVDGERQQLPVGVRVHVARGGDE